jgi:RHS repeat-associated protein
MDYTYELFGKVIVGADGEQSFTGKKQDSTGLLYFGARFYDPEIGRFITQDPAKQDLNWYAYCGNNPINRVDPDGKYYEGTIAWGSTAWALCLADGPAPAGEVVYKAAKDYFGIE